MNSELDLDRPIRGRFRLEHVLHGVVLLAACVLRLVWLGFRPLHHDESIHAYYSWRILTVGPSDYRYDPVYHGPALYYLTASLQWLLGPSDFSSRMLSVVCGIGLVALAWPLRSFIGRREALFYAALVTVSPTLGYYSRSLRHDVPIAFFTLAALVAFLHFLQHRRRFHAYLAGISIGLAAATKEDIYLTAFTFANVLWLVGLPKIGEDERGLAARLFGWATEVWEFLRRSWIPTATAVLLALTVAVVLYTSLLTHPENWNATSRALRYWWGQHSAQRIGGPWWYYVPIEIGYEALIFLPALVTFVVWIRRGPATRIQALFLAWTVLSFALYAWAQEKVPWLLVPFLLPQAFLAAHYFARQTASHLLRWSPLALFGLWSLVASSFLYDAPRTTEPPDAAHFEPIVYVQSTYDVPRILSEIEDVTKIVGSREKTNMVVVGDATWPLSWYLRDYPVHWSSIPPETRAPILIVDPGEATRLEKDLGDRYGARRFAVRGWWQIDWQKMTAKDLLRFLVYRRVWNSTGTTDAVMLVAKDLAPGGELPTVRLRPASPTRDYFATPSTLGAARVLGGPGTDPGQFSEPRGLAFDRDGRLLVADSKNNRIQKLDRDGKVIAVFGGPAEGDGPGQFRGPCGVAAAPDGSIYVADTWNHRIQKLDSEGRFVLEWREQDPGLWGPRAVAVAPNGSIFVADTGNKRILAYDPGGQRLLAFGSDGNSPAQFVEPVGLAIDSESKALYVADTGNHRVQSFDLEGHFRGAFTVFGWQEFYTEPYLAWHSGMLWATDSFNRRINAYDPLGNLKQSLGGPGGSPPLQRPLGIAVAPDGDVYVSDLVANHLVVLR